MAEGEADVGGSAQNPITVNIVRDGSSVESLPGLVDEPDPAPRWRAMFFLTVCKQRLPVLGDSGCSGSCISLEFLEKNPSLRKTFKAKETSGLAINGSDVKSVGMVRLDFKVNGNPMSIKCKVVRDLMDPVILGWDWMSKYSVCMDPANGVVRFGKNRSTPLIEYDAPHDGSFYRAFEDLVLPPFSKVHASVELVTSWTPTSRAPSSVITEPFKHHGQFYAARTCSTIQGKRFMTELLNPTEHSIRVPAGEYLGAVEFVDDDEAEEKFLRTEWTFEYGDGESLDPPPREQMSPLPGGPEETFGSHRDDIPPGAKPLKLDLSGICEDAKPHLKDLEELLEVKHKGVFSKHDRDYGRTHLIQYRAHMKDADQTPIAQPPYRTTPEMRGVIDQQTHQMLADGLIGPSKSPYAAPIMLARKKCGGWRYLTDFRKVNAVCTKVVYPLPRIEDSVQRLENPKFFSSLDLTKGFWQIPVHPDDRKFFAFSTESMHLEYLVAPMGAKNSPSYLSSLMQLVLRGLPIQHVISYLDDILVADKTMEEHLLHLDQVLTALGKAGLKLNPAKCSIARESVVCLGHQLSREGISPDPANTEKIRSWKAPDNVKKLRAFLGLTGYYRQFVRNYSGIARCLTDLLRDGCKWCWDDEHQKAFETLRDALISPEVMAYPDFKRPFIVKTDASLTAIGYVLTQKGEDKKERVISYGSKKLSQPQQRWSTYDREFFALIAGIRANAHYLRHSRFMVITDHRPLLAWRKVDARKDPTGRRTRWAIELDNYDFELVYKKGSTHCDADAMSRRGDEDDEIAEDSEDFLGLLFPPDDESASGRPSYFLGMEETSDFQPVKFVADDDEKKRLQIEQDADAIIAEVKEYVRARRRVPHNFPNTWYRRNGKWLTLKDGILYRRSYCEALDANVLQFIVPESLTGEVLNELHGSEWSGHPGVGKMLSQVHRFATWPTIAKDVKTKVKNCKVCDQLREQVPKPLTPLQPIVATRVFDHVMCDLISFSAPSHGFKYVLVFKDVFSGLIRCYKLRDKTTNGVVRSLEDLVCFLGPPKVLSSDNGGRIHLGCPSGRVPSPWDRETHECSVSPAVPGQCRTAEPNAD